MRFTYFGADEGIPSDVVVTDAPADVTYTPMGDTGSATDKSSVDASGYAVPPPTAVPVKKTDEVPTWLKWAAGLGAAIMAKIALVG